MNDSSMKIFVVGDSISIQYGPCLREYLRGFMDYARKQGEADALLNLDNPSGANGGDSSLVLAYLAAVKKAGGIDADYLLLNCGLHDIKINPATGEKQVSPAQYGRNLRAIVETVSGMKPALIWIRTTPCDEKVHNQPDKTFHRFAADGDAYNRIADRAMAEAGVPIVDLYTFTVNLGGDLYCDHVHFHRHIREKQAVFIAGWLTGHVSGQVRSRHQERLS